MGLLREEKPRYIRDQLDMVQKAVEGADPDKVGLTLEYCLEKSIRSASDFKAILGLQQAEGKAEPNMRILNPLSGKMPENAMVQPEKSNIGEYEEIVNTKTKKNKEQQQPWAAPGTGAHGQNAIQMDKKEQINAFCRQFKTTGMPAGLPEAVASSERRNSGFMDFFLELLRHEAAQRLEKEVSRRRKAARLPLKSDLGTYDATAENG